MIKARKVLAGTGEVTGAPLSLTALLSFHNASLPYFEEKWLIGEDNERRWLGKSHSPKQEQEIRDQNRQPYSMPLMVSKLNTISATMKTSRTRFKVEATIDPQDEVKAEIASIQLLDISKRSKFKDVEAEVFDSGLGICFGVSEVYLDYSDIEPKVKIRKKDYRDVVWDANSKKYLLDDDALWMAGRENFYRFQLEKQGIDTTNLNEGTDLWSGRDLPAYYGHVGGEEKDFDIITVFTHYHKTYRKFYNVIHPDPLGVWTTGGNIISEKYTSKKKAERRLRQLNLPYNMQFGIHGGGEIHVRDEMRLDKYRFTYNDMIDYEPTELEKFPYNVFFAIRLENKFISFMEFLKSPQLFMDRLWSQIDYSFGKDLKNVYEMNVAPLANGETAESAQRKAMVTGGVIFKNSPIKIFDAIQSQGVNSQWFSVVEQMQSYIDDMTGGRAFHGFSEGKNESGIAIENKARQGQLVVALFLDSFSRWKQAVGENLLWWSARYDTSERVLKTGGAELSQEMVEILKQNKIYTESLNKDGGYLRINQENVPMSHLADAEFELLVTEAELSEYQKNIKYNEMLAAEKNDPSLMTLPTWRKLKMERMDLPASDRQRLIQEYDEMLQAQAQAAERQANMEQQELDIKKAEALAKIPQFEEQQKPEPTNGKAKKKKVTA